ncbi:predicted protein [Nematostella vectensis]|uniref:Uncharacterized protein n=1 Tax=Nematostella vectensis TaxID=45351 RepID=A7ST22_NEMVE|nr:leucine-rich repeat-containing protein 73 [Nematostella vectensis]EDO33124.1 predicted protein [Nematostella vectensis]|eukprot:XP_001625224.1 predicted protein [Nematostella vectensis]
MLLGTVQITGEELSEAEVKEVCDSLRDNSIRLLSLRGCVVQDEDFKKLAECLKENDSLAQLNLNLGICNGKHRIRWLAEALSGNKSLNALFLHGTNLSDGCLEMLIPSIQGHPNLQSLDLGDCQIRDEGIQHICALLSPADDKAGVQDLTLSANPAVTPYGWTQLAVAMAANPQIKCLYLDYNNIGDYGAGVFSVAMAANTGLERVDFEGTGITDKGAMVLANVVKCHCKNLQELVLAENAISTDLIDQITGCLATGAENGDDMDASGENGHSDNSPIKS